MKEPNKTWAEVKEYIIQSLLSIVFFVIFVMVTTVCELIAMLTDISGIPIGWLIRAVGWSLSIVGASCFLMIITINSYRFLKKFLHKNKNENITIDDGSNQ